MSDNFTALVQEAQQGLSLISPLQLRALQQENPDTLVLDVRDECDLNITGIIQGTVNVSMGTLFYKADHAMPTEHRAECLANKARPIVTTCSFGLVASIAAKLLANYGFTNVHILEGGNTAWREAGLPLQKV